MFLCSFHKTWHWNYSTLFRHSSCVNKYSFEIKYSFWFGSHLASFSLTMPCFQKVFIHSLIPSSSIWIATITTIEYLFTDDGNGKRFASYQYFCCFVRSKILFQHNVNILSDASRGLRFIYSSSRHVLYSSSPERVSSIIII